MTWSSGSSLNRCVWLVCAVSSWLLAACSDPADTVAPGSGGGVGVGGAAQGGAVTAGSSSGAGGGQGGAAGLASAGQPSAGRGGGSGSGGVAQGGAAGGDSAGGGGSSGAAGSSGSGGGSSYRPCPSKGTVCKIMPMGDSITEGFRASDNRGGYRSRLFHLALAEGKSITFVGSAPLWGPDKVDGVPFPKQNEGIGGRRIDDLLKIVPTTSTTTAPNTVIVNEPDILLLEIGTNNLGEGAASMAGKLEQLLDKIIASDPELLVVLAKIIPTTTDSKNETVQAYNDRMQALVDARAALGKHLVLTDMFTPIQSSSNYETALMKDELHPNDAGYTVMANAWYDVLEPYLP